MKEKLFKIRIGNDNRLQIIDSEDERSMCGFPIDTREILLDWLKKRCGSSKPYEIKGWCSQVELAMIERLKTNLRVALVMSSEETDFLKSNIDDVEYLANNGEWVAVNIRLCGVNEGSTRIYRLRPDFEL